MAAGGLNQQSVVQPARVAKRHNHLSGFNGKGALVGPHDFSVSQSSARGKYKRNINEVIRNMTSATSSKIKNTSDPKIKSR